MGREWKEETHTKEGKYNMAMKQLVPTYFEKYCIWVQIQTQSVINLMDLWYKAFPFICFVHFSLELTLYMWVATLSLLRDTGYLRLPSVPPTPLRDSPPALSLGQSNNQGEQMRQAG